MSANNPQRIQLKRIRGWRMPENTVKVDRTTKWGNPFRVTKGQTAQQAVDAFRNWLLDQPYQGKTRDGVFRMLYDPQRLRQMLPQLEGKNLACWCKLGQPCHADVLLELANA